MTIKSVTYKLTVSIQLVSLASRELPLARRCQLKRQSFHSIGFPSEQGREVVSTIEVTNTITFPFNWFPQRVGNWQSPTDQHSARRGFHSIGFPSEQGIPIVQRTAQHGLDEFPFNWFPQRVGNAASVTVDSVKHRLVSIQLVSLASRELPSDSQPQPFLAPFPFNWFPQRVGKFLKGFYNAKARVGFHSIGFPSEQGTMS